MVCGSRATEGDYLRGLVGHVANPAVTVRIRNKPVSPTQLVAHAVELRALAPDDFDQVWCVFDVDEFPDVARAVAEARRVGIEVAVSNPCFELWLLLHFRKHTAHARTYRELLPYLKKHLSGYDKRPAFRHFQSGWPEAVPRARRLARRGTEHEVNPATGVWALVERITGA
ncbi:RloB family protein [Streptomyces sp. 4N509B]|uniref:RloB family protein n=1 Tax=Streptomyces sp. 4N509B TaxID=3457413 RepID=UPI003FD6A166